MCDGLRRTCEHTWQQKMISLFIRREAAAHVTDVSAGDCVASRPFVDGFLHAQTSSRSRAAKKNFHVPAEFSAAGLMVMLGSMMPFPMPPLDRAWTGCIEYIPGVARSGRARGQLQADQQVQPRPGDSVLYWGGEMARLQLRLQLRLQRTRGVRRNG